MGSESRRDDSLLQARLAGQVAFRVVRQALQVKIDWKAGLIPASQFGVKFTDSGAGLRQQFLLVPRLAH